MIFFLRIWAGCLIMFFLLSGAGCVPMNRAYVGIGGGYGRSFNDPHINEGVVVHLSAEGVEPIENGGVLGMSVDLEGFGAHKGQWYFQIKSSLIPGYRIGPVDFFARFGASCYNFDQLDGRFGFGMFSPHTGVGIRLHFNSHVAVVMETNVQYILRFTPQDAVPFWTSGISLFIWENPPVGCCPPFKPGR